MWEVTLWTNTWKKRHGFMFQDILIFIYATENYQCSDVFGHVWAEKSCLNALPVGVWH